jgi:flavin reductase (DIM6/NTAB) family NADH-FMN oxidoreductase RutF
MLCGSVSGRKTDKFKEAGFSAQKAIRLKETFKIAECIGDIECVLYDTKEAGDHFVFLGEAVYTAAEEKYFVNDFWDTSKVELIFHLGGKMFFKSSRYSEFKAT